MKENQILKPDYLEKERDKMQSDWIKKAFYKFIENLFRPKTAFERYGLLILVLQLASIFCSYVSYITGHAFIEQYLGVWVEDPGTVFYASVGCIVLLEIVKILSATPLFLSLIRLQGFKWFAFLCVGATFGFSMYISYDGAGIEVVNNSKPDLINIEEIQTYYDNQITAKEAEKKNFLTSPKFQTSGGVVYIKVMEGQVKPLGAEITRLTALRDKKVMEAEKKNNNIESKHFQYTAADAKTMAFIALGADLVKLIISLITAWFFVAAAKDRDIIYNGGKAPDKTTPTPSGSDKGEYGLFASLPVTEAKNNPNPKEQPQPQPQDMQIKLPPDNPNPNPKNSIEYIDNSKDSKPAIIINGFNKGAPMTESEAKKQLSKYKSRLKAIQGGSKKQGTKEKALNNIQIFEENLKRFN